jgi:Flp pilus assembly pilin Flp
MLLSYWRENSPTVSGFPACLVRYKVCVTDTWMCRITEEGTFTTMLLAHAYLISLSSFVVDRLASSRQRAHTGQGLVEYALIIGLVAVAAIIVLGVMSGRIGAAFGAISSSLNGIPNVTPAP